MDHDLDARGRELAADGFTVLRGAIPPALVMRLRAAAEDLRTLTRTAEGPAATRPPGGLVGGRLVTDFAPHVDTSAFAEWEEAPAVRAFVEHAIGADFTNDHEAFTMLYEAEDREVVQGWHRDYRDNVPWYDAAWWAELVTDLRYFNQFNAALYHDISLWIVPGSHCRDDLPGERAVVAREASSPPDWTEPGMDAATYSQRAAAYLSSMPGARQVVLSPGDVAFYRDTALHLGHYVPTVKRATLHGHFENDETRPFFEEHFGGRIRESSLGYGR